MAELVTNFGYMMPDSLIKETLNMPHRTYVSRPDLEDNQVNALSQALKDTLKEGLLEPGNHNERFKFTHGFTSTGNQNRLYIQFIDLRSQY